MGGANASGGGVTALTNGNYVVLSPNTGTATWGNGTTGSQGTLSAVKSLDGVAADQTVGVEQIFGLPNGNYVVSVNSGMGNASDTWVNGASGATLDGQNTIDAQNSLLGVAGAAPLLSGKAFVATDAAAGIVTIGLPDAGQLILSVAVADIHGQGVVEFNLLTGAQVQLNPGNPSDVALLAADPQGDVFADYRGFGVYRYSPSTSLWSMVNGSDPVALAVDAAGDAFLSIAGAGIGEFRLDGTARLLTPVAASKLVADPNGDLIGDFPGYGVYRYTAAAGAWTLLDGADPVAMTVDASGDAFLSFAGAGIGEFRPDGTARLLTPVAASKLVADPNGDLIGDFPGYGVYRYTAAAGAWTLLDGADAETLAVDVADDAFLSFAGAGVAEFLPNGTARLLTTSAASLLAAT